MKTLLNTLLSILLLCLILLVASFTWTDPQVYVLFEKLDGLEKNDQVIYKDIPVGYVQEIKFFDELQDNDTYFVATLVFNKDSFRHLYREMHFEVKSVALLSTRKQIVIDDENIVKLNRLQREEYVFGYSSSDAFYERATKILAQIEQDTQPLREEISNRINQGVKSIVSRFSTDTADSATD